MLGLLMLAGAAVLLVGGAELFAEHAAAAAARLRVSVVAIGVLLAGAEPEEAVTAVLASVQARPALAVGDALGANATMLTAALGLAALAAPLPVSRRVRRYAIGAGVAGVLALLLLLDGSVSRAEGALLVGAYAALVALVWRLERQPPVVGELAELAEHSAGGAGRAPSPTAHDVALAVLGVVVMLAGGVLAVDGAVRIVAASGLSDSAVGLTALALATTAELFALVVAAARRGVTELAVAGVVGSAAYNATLTLGGAALARPLVVTGMLGPAGVAAALPLVVAGLGHGGRLSRPAGALLVAGYAAWLVVLLLRG